MSSHTTPPESPGPYAADSRATNTTTPFPLPLTLFESYMRQDERPDHPMTFFLELRLTGSLDRPAWEASLSDTLRLHPLLTSLATRSLFRRCRWIGGDHPPAHQFVDTDQPDEYRVPRDGIDLAREPGLRIWTVRGTQSARILLQFHHASTDGLGAIQFAGDWLARYGQRTTPPGQTAPIPAAVEPLRVLQRGRLWPSDEFRHGVYRCIVRRLREMIGKPAQPLATPSLDRIPTNDSGPPPAPYHTRILAPTDLRALRRTAAGLGVSVNDLAALAMFRTLRQWNDEQGAPDGWLRLGIPLSLRLPLHDDAPASNLISYMMLSLRGPQIRAANEALAYIHRATEICSRGPEGRIFTLCLGGTAAWIPWLYRIGSARGCFCTAILANVGDVRRHLRGDFPLQEGKCVAGSVVLDSLLGAAPVRRNTRLATSIGSYGGRLYINLHSDPRALTWEQGEALADQLVSQLLQLADQPSDSTAAATAAVDRASSVAESQG